MVSGRPAPAAVPAAFFGIVLGLAGLGGSWRAARQVWELPEAVGEVILLAATIVWAVLLTLFAWKWIAAREAALAEARHPVQCCFIGLVGVATMLVAAAAIPYCRTAATALFLPGCAFTCGFAVWRSGGLWFGERDPATTTPVLYLPTVAGSFVTATVAAKLGYADMGQMFFGAGLFSWLAIESVLLHRLLVAPTLAKALRPTLGIQLAPPAVGAVALLTLAPGVAGVVVPAMIGYAILQGLVLVRLLPWIMQEPFAPSYWSFTFGATSLAIAAIHLLEQGVGGAAIAILAPILFVLANVVVAAIGAGTVYRAWQRRLLPVAAIGR